MKESWLQILPQLPRFWDALLLTLELTFYSGLIGFTLAVPVALARISKNFFVRGLATVFVNVFRGTPLLVQIFLIYFGLGQFQPLMESLHLWVFFREPYFCAIFALAINTAAYVGEVIRGGLEAVPPGEIEACQAFGFSRRQMLRRVILPRAFRITLPVLNNEVVILLKSTSLASTITLMDLMGLSRQLSSETFEPFIYYILVGLIYLVLIGLVSLVAKILENKWAMGR